MDVKSIDTELIPPISQGGTLTTTTVQEGVGYKVLRCLRLVSVEIYLGLTMFTVTVFATPSQEMVKQKACIQYYNVSLNSCIEMFANESLKSDLKDDVLRVASSYQLYGELLSLAPGTVLGLFIGPWSDRYGRKIPMVVATIGSVIKSVGIILNAVFFDLPLPYLLPPQLIMGITGGMLAMIGSGYSLASEQTTTDNRALKFFGLEVSVVLMAPLGSLVTGQLYRNYGFVSCFLLGGAVTVLSLIVVLILVTETGKVRAKPKVMLRELFTLKNIKENVHTGLMKRPNRVRQQIWLLILAAFVFILCMAGQMGINYLYVEHNFGWSLSRYTIVSTIGMLTSNLCMVPIMIVLTKVKKVPDYVLGLLGCFSMATQSLVLASTSNEWIKGPHWLFYLSYLAGMANGLAPVAIRSRMSVLVSKEEIGKVFCLLVVCESFAPLVGMPVTTTIFNSSLKYFSGLMFVVAAGLLIVPIACFLWLSRIPLKDYKNLENVNCSPKEEVRDGIADHNVDND